MVWKVTFLAFLKKESGRQMRSSHSMGNSLYSLVMLSDNISLWSFHSMPKNISAAYVCIIHMRLKGPFTYDIRTEGEKGEGWSKRRCCKGGCGDIVL